MKYYVLPYCLKIWGTSITLAPIIFSLIYYFLDPYHCIIIQSDIGSLIEGYFGIIVAGAAFSFITFLIFWGIGIITYRNITNEMHRKSIMSLIGGILTTSTFLLPFLLLLPGDMFSNYLFVIELSIIMLSYGFCVVIGSLIYRFE